MPIQKSRKILIYIFLFLILGTLNNKKFYFENILKVNEIKVSGLDEYDNKIISDNLRLIEMKNLLFLDPIRIREMIEANNLVEDYYVFKKYPSTLKIQINKTQFLAQTMNDNTIYLLGSNERLIETDKFKKDLPIIFNDLKIKKLINLKKMIDTSKLNFFSIKEIYFLESGRWDLLLDTGT